MSRVVGKIGKTIIAPVSLIIGDKATAAILSIAAIVPGPHQPIAAAAAAAFAAFSQMTAPKPQAKGTPAQLIIAAEPPRPYAVGTVMTGGILRHDVAYGPTIKKVKNPFRWQVRVLSGVGPIQGIQGEFFDFQPISSFYTANFLNTVQQLGQRPETNALLPPLPGASGAPGWDSTSRLSGCAAVGLNLRFDPDGERFAAGIPIYTALVDGEKVYDPRQDSTYPGGSGPCRIGVESTYVFNANPACHTLTYCLGRFENGIKIFGLGLTPEAIDFPAIVDWANDCDANGWTANGILYEGGAGADVERQRIQNMDDLCAAGGARWFPVGGGISFDWHRPRVSLFTLTDEDLLEAGASADGNQSIRERMNGVRPQYISPSNNWEQITADEIIGSTYRTEDGQALTQVYPLNMVTDATQAGQLAAYWMADSREIGPIDMTVNVGFRFYRPGDCGTVNSEILNYNGLAVINQRSLDPEALAVNLSMKSETPGKHAFALGEEATPPPTAIIGQTPEERDAIAARLVQPAQLTVVFRDNPAPFTPGDGQVAIAAHEGILSDRRTVEFPAHTRTGLAQLTLYRVFWDLVDEVYIFESAAVPTELTSARFVRLVSVQTSDGTNFPPPPPPPPPGTGGDPNTFIQ
jgi:hypothetical protein